MKQPILPRFLALFLAVGLALPGNAEALRPLQPANNSGAEERLSGAMAGAEEREAPGRSGGILLSRLEGEREAMEFIRHMSARKQPFVLALGDVDWLSMLNRLYSKPLVNVALNRIFEILDEKARDTQGLAYRVGGDEFALLLPLAPSSRSQEQNEQKAHELLDGIRGRIADELSDRYIVIAAKDPAARLSKEKFHVLAESVHGSRRLFLLEVPRTGPHRTPRRFAQWVERQAGAGFKRFSLMDNEARMGLMRRSKRDHPLTVSIGGQVIDPAKLDSRLLNLTTYRKMLFRPEDWLKKAKREQPLRKNVVIVGREIARTPRHKHTGRHLLKQPPKDLQGKALELNNYLPSKIRDGVERDLRKRRSNILVQLVPTYLDQRREQRRFKWVNEQLGYTAGDDLIKLLLSATEKVFGERAGKDMGLYWDVSRAPSGVDPSSVTDNAAAADRIQVRLAWPTEQSAPDPTDPQAGLYWALMMDKIHATVALAQQEINAYLQRHSRHPIRVRLSWAGSVGDLKRNPALTMGQTYSNLDRAAKVLADPKSDLQERQGVRGFLLHPSSPELTGQVNQAVTWVEDQDNRLAQREIRQLFSRTAAGAEERARQAGASERLLSYSHMNDLKFQLLLERMLKRGLQPDEIKQVRDLMAAMTDVRRYIRASDRLDQMLAQGGFPELCVAATSLAVESLEQQGIPHVYLMKRNFIKRTSGSLYPFDKRISDLWEDYDEKDMPVHLYLLIRVSGVPFVLELTGDQFLRERGEDGRFVDLGVIAIPVSELTDSDWPYIGGTASVPMSLLEQVQQLLGQDPEAARRITGDEARTAGAEEPPAFPAESFYRLGPLKQLINLNDIPSGRENIHLPSGSAVLIVAQGGNAQTGENRFYIIRAEGDWIWALRQGVHFKNRLFDQRSSMPKILDLAPGAWEATELKGRGTALYLYNEPVWITRQGDRITVQENGEVPPITVWGLSPENAPAAGNEETTFWVGPLRAPYSLELPRIWAKDLSPAEAGDLLMLFLSGEGFLREAPLDAGPWYGETAAVYPFDMTRMFVSPFVRAEEVRLAITPAKRYFMQGLLNGTFNLHQAVEALRERFDADPQALPAVLSGEDTALLRNFHNALSNDAKKYIVYAGDDEGRIFRVVNWREREGLRKTMDRLADPNIPVTADDIADLNGEIGTVMNDFPSYDEPEQMEALTHWLNRPRGSRVSPAEYRVFAKRLSNIRQEDWEDPAAHAAAAYWLLVDIQPFPGGDGTHRTAWALMNILLRRDGLQPLRHQAEWMREYYPLLGKDLSGFIRFIRSKVNAAGNEEDPEAPVLRRVRGHILEDLKDKMPLQAAAPGQRPPWGVIFEKGMARPPWSHLVDGDGRLPWVHLHLTVDPSRGFLGTRNGLLVRFDIDASGRVVPLQVFIEARTKHGRERTQLYNEFIPLEGVPEAGVPPLLDGAVSETLLNEISETLNAPENRFAQTVSGRLERNKKSLFVLARSVRPEGGVGNLYRMVHRKEASIFPSRPLPGKEGIEYARMDASKYEPLLFAGLTAVGREGKILLAPDRLSEKAVLYGLKEGELRLVLPAGPRRLPGRIFLGNGMSLGAEAAAQIGEDNILHLPPSPLLAQKALERLEAGEGDLVMIDSNDQWTLDTPASVLQLPPALAPMLSVRQLAGLEEAARRNGGTLRINDVLYRQWKDPVDIFDLAA